jgi:Fur family ferric uptake transcriptional regulator
MFQEPPNGMKQSKSKPRRHSRDIASAIRNKSRRLTGPRRAIVEMLESQRHPLTIKELFSLLPGNACDQATVYRSIHLLEGMGLVKRFDFGDGSARFELVLPGGHAHHHHLICQACSAVVEIEECFPRELEQRIAAGNGFKEITHKLEFFGICPSCQTR